MSAPEVPVQVKKEPLPAGGTATPTGHRSRKEKLVFRSFSTDEVLMEPSLISHEEFFSGSSSPKRCARNRRVVSLPALKGSRESSPCSDGDTSSPPSSRSRTSSQSSQSSNNSSPSNSYHNLSSPPKERRRKKKKLFIDSPTPSPEKDIKEKKPLITNYDSYDEEVSSELSLINFEPWGKGIPLAQLTRRSLDRFSLEPVPVSPQSPGKRIYCRHDHSNICPPFDNNHCSHSSHFCSYPRASGSRFCLSHVDEGATMNFIRCKYVKGSRECGKFIPRNHDQVVFCDIHALMVGNARVKKTKPEKDLDRVPLLLKHMRFNLDRAQGKIMEPDEQGQYHVRKALWVDEREALNNSSDSDTDKDYLVEDYVKAQRVEMGTDVNDLELTPGAGDVDSPDYNLLRNAGYYSVEEVVNCHKLRLMQQRNLFLREISILRRKFRRGWKVYQTQLRALRKKRCNFTTNPKYLAIGNGEYSDKYLHEQTKVRKETRAYLGHRRRSGQRALLHERMMKKRHELFDRKRGIGAPPGTVATLAGIKEDEEVLKRESRMEVRLRRKRQRRSRWVGCVYGGGNSKEEKCSGKAVHLSRYCIKHITWDKNQRLFANCPFRFGPDEDDVCGVAMFSEIQRFGCTIHSVPVPIKDPPESQNKKMKIEDEIDKLMDDSDFDSDTTDSGSSEDESSDEEFDEKMMEEMEKLVGDEIVNMDHFKEVVDYLLCRGVTLTDSEESEDTDEDELNMPTPDGFNASPVKEEPLDHPHPQIKMEGEDLEEEGEGEDLLNVSIDSVDFRELESAGSSSGDEDQQNDLMTDGEDSDEDEKLYDENHNDEVNSDEDVS